MRNVRSGMRSFPASDAMSQPSLGEQFPTRAADSAGRWQAAWLPAIQQQWLSSVVSRGFEVIRHLLTNSTSRAQF